MSQLEARLILAGIVLVMAVVAIGVYSLVTNHITITDREYGLCFRIGKLLTPALGTGFHFAIPWIYRYETITRQTLVVPVPPVKVVIENSIEVTVTSELRVRVSDPIKAAVVEGDYMASIATALSSVLPIVLGSETLDTMFIERSNKNEQIRAMLEPIAHQMGLNVVQVSISNMDVPRNIQEAMMLVVEAKLNNRRDMLIAENEAELADLLLAAARKYFPGDPSPEAHSGIAALLRQLRAAEDSNGTVVVGGNFGFSGYVGSAVAAGQPQPPTDDLS